MPVFLFTFHAYRSWSEDNPRGFVERNKRGVRPPHRGLARARRQLAKQPPRRFDPEQQHTMINAVRDIAHRRDWRIHAVSVTPTHTHLLVSWNDSNDANEVATTFKRPLGMALSKADGSKGNRWFSAGSDQKRVADIGHLNHLVREYLPKHRGEGGTVWVEGDG